MCGRMTVPGRADGGMGVLGRQASALPVNSDTLRQHGGAQTHLPVTNFPGLPFLPYCYSYDTFQSLYCSLLLCCNYLPTQDLLHVFPFCELNKSPVYVWDFYHPSSGEVLQCQHSWSLTPAHL